MYMYMYMYMQATYMQTPYESVLTNNIVLFKAPKIIYLLMLLGKLESNSFHYSTSTRALIITYMYKFMFTGVWKSDPTARYFDIFLFFLILVLLPYKLYIQFSSIYQTFNTVQIYQTSTMQIYIVHCTCRINHSLQIVSCSLPRVIVNIACDLLECLFISVADVTRVEFPHSSQPNASSTLNTSSSTTPITTEEKIGSEIQFGMIENYFTSTIFV